MTFKLSLGRRPSSSGLAGFESPARFREKSANQKLSPVKAISRGGTRRALVPQAPYCSSSYVSIEATCSTSCPFKEKGCYILGGATAPINMRMNFAARGVAASDVIRAEVEAIDAAFGAKAVPQDGARGGRDLRLHVGGDTPDSSSALLLAGAAARWQRRGGGSVWSYTHSWRDIDRSNFGGISIIASVEKAADLSAAAAAGYPAAIVVDRFPSKKAFLLGNSAIKVIPCPAETSNTTCVECRLCLDRDLLLMGAAIGFSAHGRDAATVRKTLRVINQEQEMQLDLF